MSIVDLCVPRGGREVLHDVSIDIAPGEVTALLGPNGAGKSTLVLTVAGAIKPTSGTVMLGDEDLTKRRPEKIRQAGLAVVPEGRRLLPELTVADNLRVATYALTPDDGAPGASTTRSSCSPSFAIAGRHRAARCRVASSRWSCSPKRSCRARRCCSSTSSRSAWRRWS